REFLAREAIDVGMQRQKTVLAVDRAQNPLAFRNLEHAHARIVGGGLKRQLLVAGNDDGARNRRKVASLAALFVILDKLVNLAPDNLPLIRLLARGNPSLEKVPIDLGGLRIRFLTSAPYRRLRCFAVAQHLESDQLVDVAGGQRRLVELDPELLHPDSG